MSRTWDPPVRTFVIRAHPPMCPSRCDLCGIKVRYVEKGVTKYREVGHPWGRNDEAWWCLTCLTTNDFAPEPALGNSSEPPSGLIADPPSSSRLEVPDAEKDEGVCPGGDGHSEEWWNGGTCTACGWGV